MKTALLTFWGAEEKILYFTITIQEDQKLLDFAYLFFKHTPEKCVFSVQKQYVNRVKLCASRKEAIKEAIKMCRKYGIDTYHIGKTAETPGKDIKNNLAIGYLDGNEQATTKKIKN